MVHSWKSYVFLFISILVTTCMFLLDPLSIQFGRQLDPIIIGIIIFGTIISIIFAFLTLFSRLEKKVIPYIALTITIINLIIILFFLYLGKNMF